MTPSYYLRFEMLFYRGRLIILEDALRLTLTLKKLQQPSNHAVVLTKGLREMIIDEAGQRLSDLHTIIAQCKAKYFKRLECEVHLIQLSFHSLLLNLETSSSLDVEKSLQDTSSFCWKFPDTAGQLVGTYLRLKDALRTNQLHRTLHIYETRNIWWSWPKHTVGYLEHCRYGHPYSAAKKTGCPECGREIPKEKPAKPVEPARTGVLVNGDAFMEAVTNSKFDVNAYGNPYANRKLKRT